ncbi:MAG: hypothetical protein AAGG01_13950 [Planctomycetota bacterium]
MSAQAKLIRAAVADGLRTLGRFPEVHASRHRSVTQDMLSSGPVLLVYTDSDRVVSSRAVGGGVRIYEREVDVHVAVLEGTRGRNDPGAELADDLDDHGEEIERWFFDRETNSPTWVEALLKRTETGPADEAANPVAAKVVIFSVAYHDCSPKRSLEEPGPLESIHASHDLAPSDGEVDASDLITLPQE